MAPPLGVLLSGARLRSRGVRASIALMLVGAALVILSPQDDSMDASVRGGQRFLANKGDGSPGGQRGRIGPGGTREEELDEDESAPVGGDSASIRGGGGRGIKDQETDTVSEERADDKTRGGGKRDRESATGVKKKDWKTNPIPIAEADDNVMCPLDDEGFNICLDLNGFSRETIDETKTYFQRAKEKWESVIVGDLETVPALGLDPQFMCNTYPSHINDLYVCGRGSDIDGVGGVLGHAFVVYKRTGGSGLPLVGNMHFDNADLEKLGPHLESVILHEMGHLLGISKVFWEDKGAVKQGIYVGENAIREWRAMGCSGSPPVELDGAAGTAFNHWDEVELDHELMTGELDACDGSCPLSRVTIGSLEDLGYEVKYDNADDYKPDCRIGVPEDSEVRRRLSSRKRWNGRTRLLRAGMDGKLIPPSEDAKARAMAYGKAMLKQSKKAGASTPPRTFGQALEAKKVQKVPMGGSNLMSPMDADKDADTKIETKSTMGKESKKEPVKFVGGDFVDVIMEEYGNIYGVDVAAESDDEEEDPEEARVELVLQDDGKVKLVDHNYMNW